MQWRLQVLTPTGAEKATIGMTRPIAELDSFRLDGRNGDCIEAKFTGLASQLGIGPRDIVSLEASLDNGGSWDPLFAGTTTKPGALRAPRRTDFKLVGLRKRIQETPTDDSVRPQQEVAETVRSLAQGHLPGGIIYDPTLVPDLTLTTGELLPRREFLGVLLDKLAAQCPGFIVAANSSYTYDGITYEPGDYVPPVTWGVLPDRRFFFRRTTGTLHLVEGEGVTVSPIVPGAEELVTGVTFIFVADGSTYAGSQLIEGPDVDTYGLAVKRVAIPVESLEQVDGEGGEFYHGLQEQSANGGASWTAWDQTTGYFRDANDQTMVRTTGRDPVPGEFAQPAIGSVGMGYSFDPATFVSTAFIKAENLNPGGYDARVLLFGALWNEILQRYEWQMLQELGTGAVETTTTINRVVGGLIVGTMIFQNPQLHEVRCSAFTLFGANGELLNRLAESYYRIPAVERLDVTVRDKIVDPRPFTTLTLADGAEVTLETAEVEYQITKAGGLRSVVRMGQGEDADLLAAGHLIQGKADRAQLGAVTTILEVS